MSGADKNKKYEAFKIPGRQSREDGAFESWPQLRIGEPVSQKPAEVSFDKGRFYEIEYDSGPVPGVGKFALKPQKIREPERDEIRDIFGRMRAISREHRSAEGLLRFFDRRIQHDNAAIFYKQARFMKDFTDDYAGSVPLSQYFPYYQLMDYEQLRTYFTWRTAVRSGHVADTSLSYAFLYIYELLNNIGVESPQEGLDTLMSFWKSFRVHNRGTDKYVLRWLKDYHIYYELPHSFKEFVDRNNLTLHYPKIVDAGDTFDLFCSISKYDPRKSAFYTDNNKDMIKDCFSFVMDRLRLVFTENGIPFDEAMFQPAKKMTVWTPFRDALFHPWMKQPERRVVLSENEIYICSRNMWAFNSSVTAESGRQLIGYIMKQMESGLRKALKYKFKLSANLSAVMHPAVGKLNAAGLSLETLVNDAVSEFHREATRTVVRVDPTALQIIRKEALDTQEKLVVPEQEKQAAPVLVPADLPPPAQMDMLSAPSADEPQPVSDVWTSLKDALTETETEALYVIWHGEMPIKQFADQCGIMLEVLADGINGKAMDFVGDNLMDEDFVLYDDYNGHVKELIE